MPKISYLDQDEALFDDTEVTQAQIEAKVAEIEELLRGRIDKDNLLSYQNDTEPITIPPSIIRDLPAETRPVGKSMKFFGTTADNPDSIVDTLYGKTVALQKESHKFAMVNGIGDKEILVAFTSGEGNCQREISRSLEIDIPSNYVPVTYREIYEIIKDLKFDMKLTYEDYGDFTISEGFDNLDDFLMNAALGHEADDFVFEEYITTDDKATYFIITPLKIDLFLNTVKAHIEAGVQNINTAFVFKYVPTVMFRKNP